jgi:hypothetical protein
MLVCACPFAQLTATDALAMCIDHPVRSLALSVTTLKYFIEHFLSVAVLVC